MQCSRRYISECISCALEGDRRQSSPPFALQNGSWCLNSWILRSHISWILSKSFGSICNILAESAIRPYGHILLFTQFPNACTSSASSAQSMSWPASIDNEINYYKNEITHILWVLNCRLEYVNWVWPSVWFICCLLWILKEEVAGFAVYSIFLS